MTNNKNNMYLLQLKNGVPEYEIRDELRQGVHRPERLGLKGIEMFGGSGFIRYFFGDSDFMYYKPTDDKNPYILDEDIMFYKGIGLKGYYVTFNKEKEKFNDAGDDFKSKGRGSENIFFIPLIKSFRNLDETDKAYIEYIVYLKQGYFPDHFGNVDEFVNEADDLRDKYLDDKEGIGSKMVKRYPILLKPEYNLDALYNAADFHFKEGENIVLEAYIDYKKSEYLYDKELVKNGPTE